MIEARSHSGKNIFDRLVRGVVGRLLLILGFICYIIFALYPFDWDPPRGVTNGAEFLQNGNLSFRTAGILCGTRTPEWTKLAMETGGLTVDLRVRTYKISQTGPRRIFTQSLDIVKWNITVGQCEEALVVRLYSPDETEIRLLEFVIPDVFEVDVWRDISVHVNRNRLTVDLEGVEVYDQALPWKDPLAYWNKNYKVALGNEHSGRRAWLGEIASVKVRIGEFEYDQLRSEEMHLPAYFWSARSAPTIGSAVQIHFYRNLLRDYIANFICFLPLGFLIAARGSGRGQLLRAILICGFASLGIEVAQICFVHSFPSIYDWGLNTAGATTGAVLALLAGKYFQR
ncbi:MAG: VanZ family protein [Verrucomicrobia bacterium]|nr:VanZ family protein [Verrucomicrobiota bacterium]